MTQIDFYVLPDVDLTARARFACRLASKAFRNGTAVMVHHEDRGAAEDLDELLWRYPEQRFLPHGLLGTDAAREAPVKLCWEDPGSYDGVLINLTHEIPGFFARFDRVAEIVVAENRSTGRERYKFYRDRGFPLLHHELNDWEAA